MIQNYKKDTSRHQLNTAVLFLVFNRLGTTKQVFEAIKKAKPPRLYIAADGARKIKDGEDEKVQKVRDFILENINWKCDVMILFREKNLGCKYAVSEAIDWFFKNEEMGIILEDDCLANQSFFWFCEELLEKYKDNIKVWQISGNNFQNGLKHGDGDYYFSKYNHIWGWASWRNRWQKYNVELNDIKNTKFLEDIFQEEKILKKWKKTFESMKNNEIDTWDNQWAFYMWFYNGLSITPNINWIWYRCYTYDWRK